MARTIQRYGWHRQLPDLRDRSFNSEEPDAVMAAMPAKVDPLTAVIPRYDQLQLGSCVGNGVARALEYEAYKQGEGKSTPSRLFVYGGARTYEGTYSSDSGAEVRDGIKTVVKLGAPAETLWPYSDANPGPFNAPIPPEVFAAAVPHEALIYRTVTNGPGRPFRASIAAGMPMVFGFSVPQFFDDGSWDPVTQVLPLPGPNDQIIGGHCVVADGYDFTCTDFPVPFWWVANSWGEPWGCKPPNDANGGYFRMDYRYPGQYATGGVATDFWNIGKVK